MKDTHEVVDFRHSVTEKKRRRQSRKMLNGHRGQGSKHGYEGQ